LLAYEFRDHADGSLYLELKTAEREGRSSKREKVSYHATGRIKFSGPLDHVTFGEHIFALTELQEIACFSLADLDALHKVGEVKPGESILDVPEQEKGRANLHLIIGPDSDVPSMEGAVTITYPGWFKLHLFPGPPLPLDLAEGSTRIIAAPSR
jgi:hypothetical protein